MCLECFELGGTLLPPNTLIRFYRGLCICKTTEAYPMKYFEKYVQWYTREKEFKYQKENRYTSKAAEIYLSKDHVLRNGTNTSVRAALIFNK